MPCFFLFHAQGLSLSQCFCASHWVWARRPSMCNPQPFDVRDTACLPTALPGLLTASCFIWPICSGNCDHSLTVSMQSVKSCQPFPYKKEAVIYELCTHEGGQTWCSGPSMYRMCIVLYNASAFSDLPFTEV